MKEVMNDMDEGSKLFNDALNLLKDLIAIPSFSKEEKKTAHAIEAFLLNRNIRSNRYLNNVWALNKYFNDSKPTILLNSHHDTVKPNSGYTNDPFDAKESDGKLFGLGSNDAGGSLVSLIATFIHFYNKQNLPFNLIIAATAEEEISGHDGIEILLPMLPTISCGIVGEPTLLKMAVAEKGLLVLDCVAKGIAGHAARNEGVNAIYKAVSDINWFNTFSFEKKSPFLDRVHMTVTSISTKNIVHNVVPSECTFVVDIRVNECYTFEEIILEIKRNVGCDVIPRSTRLRPSFIEKVHALVVAGDKVGLESYGSPTCSDRALMNFPTLKLGPGDSARSHSANEFIFTEEIKKAIELYIQLLGEIKFV